MQDDEQSLNDGVAGDDAQDDEWRVEEMDDEPTALGGARLAAVVHWLGSVWRRRGGAGWMPRGLVWSLAALLALVLVLLASDAKPAFGTQLVEGGAPVPVQPSEAAPAITISGHAPIRMGAGSWEQIALPLRSGDTLVSLVNSLVNAPDDPQTLYACTRGPAIPGGVRDEGELTVWRTRDAGAHWTSLPLPRPVALGCDVTLARDTPSRITVQVTRSSHDWDAPGCSDVGYYLSDDGGDSWMRVTHTTLAPNHNTGCSTTFWPTAHHLYITMVFTRQDVVTRVPAPGGGTREIPSTVNTLERSDDEGRTWVRADGSLVDESSTFSVTQGENEDTLMATASSPQFPDAPFWQSRDAGRSWRHLDLPLVQGDMDLALIDLDRGLLPPVYGYSPGPDPYSNWRTFDLRFAQLGADGHSWTLLPSLPVPGMDAKHTGLYNLLDQLPDGRLLAVGATPEKGVPPPDVINPPPNPHPRRIGPEWFAVWSWDPRAAHWQRVSSPAADLIARNCSAGCDLRATSGPAQAGQAARTYLWMRTYPALSANTSPSPALYRLALDAHPLT